MIDLHNHLLPGLDDGASDWEQSLAMARTAVQDGIKGIVCTPHWILGQYENTRQPILSTLEELRVKLAEHHIQLDVYPGAELRLDVRLAKGIQSGELLTINDTGRFTFVELPWEILPPNLEDFLWDLQVQKITPIISHPERNQVLLQDPVRLYNWVQMGVLTQLTAASLLGYFGRQTHEFSIFLLEHHLAHVLATDAHGLCVRAPKLSQACEVAQEIVGAEMARQMVSETPRQIIAGVRFHPPDPIAISTGSRRPPFWKRLFSRNRA
jgi:protein-tyrosine phosphatase